MSAPKKPRLVVHAGLPKCATSTVQRLFVAEDYRFSKHIGVAPLGKSFKPFSKFPPVMEIRGDPDRLVRAIEDNTYDPDALYFLSSEALAHGGPVFQALLDRFDVLKIVYTVRMPMARAWSAYCYSGWLSGPVTLLFGSSHGMRIAMGERRLQACITKMRDTYGRAVTLCPIEPDDLELRFNATCFDMPFEQIRPGLPALHKMNQSFGILPAAIFAEEIFKRPQVPPRGDWMALTRLAKDAFRGQTEANAALPAAIYDDVQTLDVAGHAARYRETSSPTASARRMPSRQLRRPRRAWNGYSTRLSPTQRLWSACGRPCARPCASTTRASARAPDPGVRDAADPARTIRCRPASPASTRDSPARSRNSAA